MDAELKGDCMVAGLNLSPVLNTDFVFPHTTIEFISVEDLNNVCLKKQLFNVLIFNER